MRTPSTGGAAPPSKSPRGRGTRTLPRYCRDRGRGVIERVESFGFNIVYAFGRCILVVIVVGPTTVDE